MKTIALALVVVSVMGTTAHGQEVFPDVTAELVTARRVLTTPKMAAAVAYVDGADDETVQEWLSLCNAYGPSGDEIQRSRLIYKLFRIYGLENVHIDDEYNVVGIRRGTGGGPAVVLNAHHDNVALWPRDQPVEAFVADGRVWCPAAGDDLMGVVQILTVVRAMNAANIETKGEVWFVTFTGEEPATYYASRGVEHFVRANYPQNLDWRKGDIIVQLHGGGGEGVSVGSTPIRHRTMLRVYSPFEKNRWERHGVDALGRIITRISDEVRDPRASTVSLTETGAGQLTDEILYLNMSMIGASEILNGTAGEAWIRFDLRSPTEARLLKAHADIRRIAQEVTNQAGEGLDFVYEISSKNGTESGIDGWDDVNNAAARMAVAASQALYGTRPVIDPERGCGDCVQAYVAGMPAMSLRGSVIDYGDKGRFEVGAALPLRSAVRRRSVSHDVTESADINRVWSGVKHALLFAVAYAGMAEDRDGQGAR